MIIPFAELNNYAFSVSDVNVIYQKPSYRYLEIKSRSSNGILYITEGECKYSFENGEFSASPGTIIYLPSGSKHELVINSDEFEFFRVDFVINIENKSVLFSTTPCVLTTSASPECIDAIKCLERNCHFENRSVIKTENICKIFSSIENTAVSPLMKKLAPAVNYINEHLTEGFSCRELANMCYLSTSQFYELFAKEYKMTPLEYRDNFILNRAKILLKTEGISISETAYMLGFDTPAYFSRFFKKHLNISPREYQNKRG